MRPITLFLTSTRRALGGSVAVLMLNSLIMSTMLITGANAADVATLYSNSCAACHDSGALNAIKKGDSAKWQQLKKQKGMPALINSVKSGMIQMPAGGLCDNCKDDDYRQLIEYMSK